MTNYIYNVEQETEKMVGTVKDIIKGKFVQEKTAFIGTVGYLSGLFLVCFECVMLAEAPNNTWSKDAPMEITKWVDINIFIRGE